MDLLWREAIAGGAANAPVELTDFPLIPFPPYEHLWFLWALFLIQLAAWGGTIGARSLLKPTQIRLGMGAMAVFVAVMMSLVNVSPAPFGLALVHLPAFLFGAMLGVSANSNRSLVTAALALLAAFLVLYGAGQGVSVGILSLGMVICLWRVFQHLDTEARAPGLAVQWLRELGKASMAIYLAHTIFSAGLRIALIAFGVTSVPLHLGGAVLVGVVGPLVFLWGAKRLGIRKVFGI